MGLFLPDILRPNVQFSTPNSYVTYNLMSWCHTCISKNFLPPFFCQPKHKKDLGTYNCWSVFLQLCCSRNKGSVWGQGDHFYETVVWKAVGRGCTTYTCTSDWLLEHILLKLINCYWKQHKAFVYKTCERVCTYIHRHVQGRRSRSHRYRGRM